MATERTTDPVTPALARLPRPGHAARDLGKPLAILGAWQLASYRGYTVAERRRDRRLVVQALAAELAAERLTVNCLLLVADTVSRDQWRDLLARNDGLPKEWAVQAAEDLLAEGTRVRSDCVVIADELDTYLTDEIAAALSGVRSILGLCATPSGLSNTPRLRKYIGRALDLSQTSPALDLQKLLANNKLRPGVTNQEDFAELREQALTVNDTQDLLRYYLDEIQRYPLLSSAEEIELAKKIEAGLVAEAVRDGRFPVPANDRTRSSGDLRLIASEGREAKRKFITSNLRLVYHIARRYNRRIEIMDGIQEGNLGLIHAVEKFDCSKGYKFSTYGTWWIRQAITRAIADRTYLIRIPVHTFETDAAVLHEWNRQAHESGGTSATEVAAVLGLGVAEVESTMRRHQPPHSLEVLAEAGIDLMDPAAGAAQEQLEHSFLCDRLHSVLDTLGEREAGVIRLRYGLVGGDPRTLDEIGKVYGVTRERIRQVQNNALLKLRHPSRSELLRDYFDGNLDPALATSDSELKSLKKHRRQRGKRSSRSCDRTYA